MALILKVLQEGLLNAMKKAQTAKSGAAGNQILATELAKAIDAYIKSGDVNTQVATDVITVVAPGIPVATAGSAVAQVGATTTPGAGKGAGVGVGLGKIT
jgi:hypothetical protein